MTQIDKLEEYKLESGELTPPQLFPYWARILDKWDSYAISSKGQHLNFYIVETSFGKVLISMPYIGYGSCFTSTEGIKELFSDLEAFARDNDCLTMSVCTHPLATVPFDKYHDLFDYDYSYKNFCQISTIDKHPLESVSHKRRMAFNSEIARCSREGYIIDKHPDAEIYDQWLECYKSRVTDLDAIPFPDWFFDNYYRESQKDDKVDFWVVRDESTILGGIFCARGNNIVDYCTSAFKTEYRKLYPTTYILNEYFNDAVSRGIKYFNWQSSPVKNEGTYNFKKRWGAEEYEHYYFAKTLAPLENILEIPLQKIKKELVGCYMLPYSLWGEEPKK